MIDNKTVQPEKTTKITKNEKKQHPYISTNINLTILLTIQNKHKKITNSMNPTLCGSKVKYCRKLQKIHYHYHI